MSTDTLTLTDFLLARIADDEAVANQVRPDEHLNSRDGMDLAATDSRGYAIVGATSARVLAQCKAHRAIVESHGPRDFYAESSGELVGAGCEGDRAPWPCPTLRALASIYADHPDYRDEWAD